MCDHDRGSEVQVAKQYPSHKEYYWNMIMSFLGHSPRAGKRTLKMRSWEKLGEARQHEVDKMRTVNYSYMVEKGNILKSLIF